MKNDEIKKQVNQWANKNQYDAGWLDLMGLSQSQFDDLISKTICQIVEIYGDLSIDELADIITCELTNKIYLQVSEQIDWNERFIFIHSSPHFETEEYEFSLGELSEIDTKAEDKTSHPITPASIIGDLVNLHFRQDGASVRMFKVSKQIFKS